jgi:dTDP-4-amino-4,6-dideoxygalactose transaminase
LPVIRQYRQTFARLIDEGAESFDELNPLFDQAEQHYYADLTVLGDSGERAAVERLDWSMIEATRKANHQRLCDQLADVPEIEIIFPEVSPHGPPLGLPIYVKNGQRDVLLNYLRERHVYPIVHWDVLHDSRIIKIPETVDMSAKILTLILDQRFSLEDMDYEASSVKAFFGH